MIETNRVVAHYLDGRLVKGTTDDFLPNRPKFHLHQVGGGAPVEIECKKLKALFFVRDLAGKATRPDIHGFGMVVHEGNPGKKIATRRWGDSGPTCSKRAPISSGSDSSLPLAGGLEHGGGTSAMS